jgi:site-specific DNA-adenine methylase
MRYFGGKNRNGNLIARKLINPIIMCTDFDYIEPFVGSGGVYKHVINFSKNRSQIQSQINDLNYFVYAFHAGIKQGYEINDFKYNDYNLDLRQTYERLKIKYKYNIELKNGDIIPDCLIAYIGFSCAFGGQWFGSFAVDKKNPNRDYFKNSLSSNPQQLNYINTKITNKSYEDMEIYKNNVIYCDPPYQNTGGYKTGDFNTIKFLNWCDKIAEDNILLISEYNIDDDRFVEIFNFNFTKGMGNNDIIIEKIYTHKKNTKHEIIQKIINNLDQKNNSEQLNLF